MGWLVRATRRGSGGTRVARRAAERKFATRVPQLLPSSLSSALARPPFPSRSAGAMRAGTAARRAHTHAHAVDAHDMGETSVVRDLLRAHGLGASPHSLQEAIDAARANPFRGFVGSIASGAGAGAIVSTGARAHACACAPRMPLMRACHAGTRSTHGCTNQTRAWECTFMRTYFNACAYMHVCMHTHVYAYILKRVHLCTRAQVGMLTGAVAGLAAGRMQLGRDSQSVTRSFYF